MVSCESTRMVPVENACSHVNHRFAVRRDVSRFSGRMNDVADGLEFSAIHSLQSSRHKPARVPRVVVSVVSPPCCPTPASVVWVAGCSVNEGQDPFINVSLKAALMVFTETVSRRVLLSLLRVGLTERGPSVDEVSRLRYNSTIVDAWLFKEVHNALLTLDIVRGNFDDVGIDGVVVGLSQVIPV